MKGRWAEREDKQLIALVAEGHQNWSKIASLMPGRTSKQCRERWINYLDPTLKHAPFSEEEDAILLSLQSEHGNKWSLIAKSLPGRTENAAKQRFYILIKQIQKNNGLGMESSSNQGTSAPLQQAHPPQLPIHLMPTLMGSLQQPQQQQQQPQQQQQMQQSVHTSSHPSSNSQTMQHASMSRPHMHAPPGMIVPSLPMHHGHHPQSMSHDGGMTGMHRQDGMHHVHQNSSGDTQQQSTTDQGKVLSAHCGASVFINNAVCCRYVSNAANDFKYANREESRCSK